MMIIGKTNDAWANELLGRLPKQTKKRTILLVGCFAQIFFSLFAKIALFNVVWIGDNSSHGAIARAFLKIMSFFSSDILVANQGSEAIFLKLGIPSKKIYVVYPVCSVKNTHLLTQEYFVIACDGSIKIEHGLGVLIRGISLAQEILGNIKLIIGGILADKPRIEWLSSELGLRGCMQIAPSTSHAWCEPCDIYILINQNNSQIPVSLAQAMSFSKPIITNDALSRHEFIEHRRNGIIIKDANAEMLSQAIINLARKPEWMRELGQNNREFAEQKLSERVFEEKIKALFYCKSQ